MDQKKYMSIVRLGHSSTKGVLNQGDHIVIQEKLDGSNASFMKEKNRIRAFSRNTELNGSNTLGGFYQFAKSLDVDGLLDGIIYFGEWLNPHKVRYPNFEKQFFLFDLYDLSTNKYLPFQEVKKESERLKLNLIPVFYEGEYKGFDHLQQFVGKTFLGGRLGDIETGEGIVIKNINYVDRYGKQVFVKFVTDAFREVQKQKPARDPRKLPPEFTFVDACLTKARVEKILYKLIDEGTIDEQFSIKDMSVILKNACPRIYEDMLKEETEMLPEEYDAKKIRKTIGKKLPNIIKSILNENKEINTYKSDQYE